ncbi:DUF6193 family natural product biosynthesis protein [Spirillospora sp. NPDC047279]|uniref:DUF6193 family natural product biosynthesis protein n=1 Tax=Spirillospora sp. NPDC047279 TaxID=3155478 RepID=UPI0033CB0E4C
MRQEPDPAVLYPDVVALGSLAAALQAAAADQGLDLGLIATPSDPLRHATAPSTAPHREPLIVTAWRHERRWSVWGSANNGPLVQGRTDDLCEIPAVIHGWAEGSGLGEIERAVPFEILTGRDEVPDDDPADVIAAEWRWMLKDARDTRWPEYQALIEAAYAEPRLRRLYPYASHWSLGFAADPNLPFSTPSFVSLESPRGGGDYTVKEWWGGSVLSRVTTPAEAVSIAVDRIPVHFDLDDQASHGS